MQSPKPSPPCSRPQPGIVALPTDSSPFQAFFVSHSNTTVGLGRQEGKPCPGCSASFQSCSSDLVSDPWYPSSPALSSLSCCDSVACRPFSCSSFLSQIPGLSPSVRGQRPSFHGVSPPSYYCVNFWFPGSSSLPSQGARGTWMLPRSHLDISPTSSCPVSKLTNLTTLLQIFWPIPLPGSLCLIWNLGTSPGEGLDLRWAPLLTSIHCEVIIISGIPSHSPQKSCFLKELQFSSQRNLKLDVFVLPSHFLPHDCSEIGGACHFLHPKVAIKTIFASLIFLLVHGIKHICFHQHFRFGVSTDLQWADVLQPMKRTGLETVYICVCVCVCVCVYTHTH